MTIDKDKLRALAEAATQGDWGQDGTYIAKASQGCGTTHPETWPPIGQAFRVEDAKFIAAANPATILALLGEIAELQDVMSLVKDEDLKWKGLREQEADIKQLKAENEALRLDAERFRWMRANWFSIYSGSRGPDGIVITSGSCWNKSGRPHHVDEAIDAAMTGEHNQ